jgi:hypothetical protein
LRAWQWQPGSLTVAAWQWQWLGGSTAIQFNFFITVDIIILKAKKHP